MWYSYSIGAFAAFITTIIFGSLTATMIGISFGYQNKADERICTLSQGNTTMEAIYEKNIVCYVEFIVTMSGCNTSEPVTMMIKGSCASITNESRIYFDDWEYEREYVCYTINCEWGGDGYYNYYIKMYYALGLAFAVLFSIAALAALIFIRPLLRVCGYECKHQSHFDCEP